MKQAATLSHDHVSLALESALSRVPTKVGYRLRSEDDLAALFKVGRWRLRKSVDRLVGKGILVRRRGSGTYVRKVADAIADREPGNYEVTPPILPQALFAEYGEGGQPSYAEPIKGSKRLQLGLWCYMHAVTPVNQMILNGIMGKVNHSGHRMVLHSMIDSNGVAMPREKIVDQLRESPSDGHIVPVQWADQFLEAMGTRHTPTLFFSHEARPIRYESEVILGGKEAIGRAVMLLAGEGYQRIAMIGLESSSGHNEHNRVSYERAVHDAGLDYCKAVFSELWLGQSIAVTRQLLAHDAPDAIYVADDYILSGVAEAIATEGIVMGRDLGLITLSNYGHPLPPGNDWSRMEFDPEGFGKILAEKLLGMIQVAGGRMSPITVHATWKPGQTHRRLNNETGRKEIKSDLENYV